MLSDALSYPSNSDDWLKTIVIGGILLFTSFLIIPAFLLQGYFARVLRSAARNDDTPPSFEDWEEMLDEGLKMTVIGIAYTLSAIILPVIVVAVGTLISDILGVILGLLTVVLVFAISYIMPVALTNFALTGEFGAAFEIKQITDAAFTSQYFVAVILAVVVGGILSLISALLSLLLVGLFLFFYTEMVIFYLYGRGCGPNLHPDPQVREPTSSPGHSSR
jgi:hypothetical protein